MTSDVLHHWSLLGNTMESCRFRARRAAGPRRSRRGIVVRPVVLRLRRRGPASDVAWSSADEAAVVPSTGCMSLRVSVVQRLLSARNDSVWRPRRAAAPPFRSGPRGKGADGHRRPVGHRPGKLACFPAVWPGCRLACVAGSSRTRRRRSVIPGAGCLASSESRNSSMQAMNPGPTWNGVSEAWPGRSNGSGRPLPGRRRPGSGHPLQLRPCPGAWQVAGFSPR